jgi:hypothetical protein
LIAKEKKMEEGTMDENTTDRKETGSATLPDSVPESGKSAYQVIEEGWEAAGSGIRHVFHVLPGHGTIPGFAVGVGAAMLLGVGELAVGCFTAYVSYRYFAYGESLSEAIEKAIKFESGTLEKKEITKPIPKDI